jgi:hypothetical protein
MEVGMLEKLEELDWRVVLVGGGCAAAVLCLAVLTVGFAVFGARFFGISILP